MNVYQALLRDGAAKRAALEAKEKAEMTTPNEELITRLGVIANTEANELADALNEAAEALQSQQELLSSQAARIKELEGGVAHWKALRKAAVNVANDRREERDTLRAQLDAIAATEPVGKVEIAHDMNDAFMRSLPIGTKLFTRPMPAQDVSALSGADAHKILLDMAEHIDTFGSGSESDAQVSAECIRFILAAANAKGAK